MTRYASVKEFREKVGELTAAEERLLKAVREGVPCFLPTGKLADVVRPTAPSDAVTIRAEFLRILILGGTRACGLDGRGVTLLGGWIKGALDLAFATARGLTRLDTCHFTDVPSFYMAHLKQLDLSGSHLPGLIGQSMQVEGSVFLNQINFTGTVSVNGAKIGKQLSFHGATLNSGEDADGTAIYALNAQGAEVGECLFLSQITATGTVDVTGAKIGGQLSCNRATLNGGEDAKGKARNALNAQGVEVGQHLFFSQITATGTVDLNAAIIGGQFACDGPTLNGGTGRALHAQRLHVTQSFFFRDVKQVTGQIDLTAAHIGDLADDMDSWPLGTDQLLLDGFTYDRILGPTTFDARKDWLRVGSHWKGEFLPQPYTQLARVLRGMGHDRQARRVLFEMEKTLGEAQWEKDKRRYLLLRNEPSQTVRGDIGGHWFRMWSARLWDLSTREIAGYGHLPQRSAYWLGILLFAAFCLYWLTWTLGGMVPDSDVIMVSDDWAEAMRQMPGAPAHHWITTEPGTHYETFSTLAYALDIVVPIIDLGQEEAWAATTATKLGMFAWAATWGFKLMGWLVTALGAAAVTGLIRRDRGE